MDERERQNYERTEVVIEGNTWAPEQTRGIVFSDAETAEWDITGNEWAIVKVRRADG